MGNPNEASAVATPALQAVDLAPRKLYNVVDPSTLARVHAGAMIAYGTAYGQASDRSTMLEHAADAVRDFVALVQEPVRG